MEKTYAREVICLFSLGRLRARFATRLVGNDSRGGGGGSGRGDIGAAGSFIGDGGGGGADAGGSTGGGIDVTPGPVELDELRTRHTELMFVLL